MTKELNLFVMVDSEGNHVVSTQDAEHAATLFAEEFDEMPANLKTFHLKLTVPLPRTAIITGTIADEQQSDAVKLTTAA